MSDDRNDGEHYIVDRQFIDGVLDRASSVSNNALYALVAAVAAFIAVIATILLAYKDSPSEADYQILLREQATLRSGAQSQQTEIFGLKNRMYVLEREAGIERPVAKWGNRLRTKNSGGS